MVHVLCFGNLWRGDDGFGIHVGRRLQAMADAKALRVFEVGLRGLDALPLFERCEAAILVDALHAPDLPAGTLQVVPAAEVAADPGADSHAAGVGFLLNALAATRPAPPPVILVGAVAERIAPFTAELSPALAGAVDAAAQVVVDCAAGLAGRRTA